MIEIDVVKATSQYHRQQNKSLPPSFYTNDDTDISEPDTALNTPTGSITDSLSRRYSSSSASTTYNNSSFKNYHTTQRKPSFIPKSPELSPQPTVIEALEKKIQVLENDLSDYIKKEADLQSQVLMLAEKQTDVPNRQYKSALTRISKQVEKFLVTHEIKNNNKRDSSICWSNENSGINEISCLFDEKNEQSTSTNNNSQDFETKDTSTASSIPMVLIYRLKTMMDHFMTNTESSITQHRSVQEFYHEVTYTLSSWQEFYHTNLVQHQEKKANEETRVTRLLEALQKVLIKNKVMKRDHAILIKKYKADMKSLVKDISIKRAQENQPHDICHNKRKEEEAEQKDRQDEIKTIQKHFSQTKVFLEAQISKLEKELCNCQDERDEYETTLEMVRREMETMLEELEDTRQQRLRYKTQASRLRVGLEAIQKRAAKNNINSDDDESGNDDNDEDEGTEALRLMYNEAERQAVDLDRECKRQTLTVNSIRQELKLTAQKYDALKSENSKELKQLQRLNQKLCREIEVLENEKQQLVSLRQQQQQQQVQLALSSSSNTVNNDHGFDDEQLQYQAKIFALQIALKASKCDAVIQRTRISQLERQSSLTDLNNDFVAGLQHSFRKKSEIMSNDDSDKEKLKEIAAIVEMEQKVWRLENKRQYQKRYDVDLLRVNRELRFLSCRLGDVEDESSVLKSRHEDQLSLLRYQIVSEFEKRVQQLSSRHQLEIQELQNQIDVLFQTNQTLKEESLILYGRNMLMANRLGKIES